MATITSSRRTYKNTGLTTDSHCIRIERTDGTIFRYTDCSRDLTMTQYVTTAGSTASLASPVTYSSINGMNISAIGFTDATPGEMDIEGVLLSTGIDRDDIISGIFTNARIYVFLTSWANPIEDDEKLYTGFWGESTLVDGRFIIKFTSLLDALNIPVGRLYTRLCDAQFGGNRCRVNNSPVVWSASTAKSVSPGKDASLHVIVKPTVQNGYWYKCTTAGTTGGTEPTWSTSIGATVADGTVVWTTIYANIVTNTYSSFNATTGLLQVGTTFSGSLTASAPYVNGYVEFTSGENMGQKYRIRQMITAGLYLHTPIVKPPTSGSPTITIHAGCNKRLDTDCAARYDNSYNYQGFPYIPGKTNVGYIAGTK